MWQKPWFFNLPTTSLVYRREKYAKKAFFLLGHPVFPAPELSHRLSGTCPIFAAYSLQWRGATESTHITDTPREDEKGLLFADMPLLLRATLIPTSCMLHMVDI